MQLLPQGTGPCKPVFIIILGVIDDFVSSNMSSTFCQCGSKLVVVVELPGDFYLDCTMFYGSNTWCLHQYSFTVDGKQ